MALTANNAVSLKNRLGQTMIDGVIVTSGIIYNHALVARNAAGTLEVPNTAVTQTFVGLAEVVQTPNTTAGITGDGTLRINCIGDVDALVVCVTAITVGQTGAKVYAVDDQIVTTEATLGPECGFITEFVATNSVWVRLRGNTLVAAS